MGFINIISDFSLFYLIQDYNICVWIRKKQREYTINFLIKKYSDLIEEYKTKTITPKENSNNPITLQNRRNKHD